MKLLHRTTSLCRACRNAIAADVVATDDGEVWMRKRCDEHGAQEVRLSTSAAWYEATRAIAQHRVGPRANKRPIELGCPFDCGPCDAHGQKVRLPVVTITSACNLDCPICYVHNKNDDAYHMSREDFARILDHLRDDHGGELDIVNITGGEPTLHPQLLDFIAAAKAAGIHRVTVCSNGLRLVKDEALVEALARLDARVALSFDSFEDEADYALQGAHLVATKLRCLDLLERHGVSTTLIPVMTRGVNDHEVGRLIAEGIARSNVRHLEIHTITYTGQGGRTFDLAPHRIRGAASPGEAGACDLAPHRVRGAARPGEAGACDLAPHRIRGAASPGEAGAGDRAGRITMLEVLEKIEETTGGALRVDDFVPSPCAHPLCYQIAYLLVDPDGGPPIPFTRFMSREELYQALSDRLYMEPTPALEAVLHTTIDRLWSQEDVGDERALALLKRMLVAMFQSDRAITREAAMAAGERAVKAVYVHSHMDEDNFDVERAMDCCDSNCYADGTTIPVCNSNVLYRDKEPRFTATPAQWNERRGGLRLPVIR